MSDLILSIFKGSFWSVVGNIFLYAIILIIVISSLIEWLMPFFEILLIPIAWLVKEVSSWREHSVFRKQADPLIPKASGILITDEMTAQDIEKLREARRNRGRGGVVLPQSPSTPFDQQHYRIGSSNYVPPPPPQKTIQEELQDIDDLPF